MTQVMSSTVHPPNPRQGSATSARGTSGMASTTLPHSKEVIFAAISEAPRSPKDAWGLTNTLRRASNFGLVTMGEKPPSSPSTPRGGGLPLPGSKRSRQGSLAANLPALQLADTAGANATHNASSTTLTLALPEPSPCNQSNSHGHTGLHHQTHQTMPLSHIISQRLALAAPTDEAASAPHAPSVECSDEENAASFSTGLHRYLQRHVAGSEPLVPPRETAPYDDAPIPWADGAPRLSVPKPPSAAVSRRVSIADKAFHRRSCHSASREVPLHRPSVVPNSGDALDVSDGGDVFCEGGEETPRRRGGSASQQRPLLPPELLPQIADRSHQHRKKSVVEESITRKRNSSAGVCRPAFGSSTYARPGLPDASERETLQREARVQSILRQCKVPALEEQIEAHFRDFEPVVSAPVCAVLDDFEVRLAEVEARRKEREAAEERRRLEVHLKQQQNQHHRGPPQAMLQAPIVRSGNSSRRASVSPGATATTPVPKSRSSTPVVSFAAAAAAAAAQEGEGNAPPEGMTPPGNTLMFVMDPSHTSSAAFSALTVPIQTAPPPHDPTATRDFHLLKLLFRRSLLHNNTLFQNVLVELGEPETLARLRRINSRYGCRRLSTEDFYFLMQELVTMPPELDNDRRLMSLISAGGGSKSRASSVAGLGSSMLDETPLLDVTGKEEAQNGGGGTSLAIAAPRSAANFDSIPRRTSSSSSLAVTAHALSASPTSRNVPPSARKTDFSSIVVRRSETDMLFAACDMNMSGAIDDEELVDAVQLLFRPEEILVASHCKRVIEGRCSISHMLSLYEAELMLNAVATVGAHRYGEGGLRKDVGYIMEMLHEVQSNAHVPLVCFRNFVVHGRLLSRALDEMTLNAELPPENIRAPSPDPDRDVKAVAAAVLEVELAQQQLVAAQQQQLQSLVPQAARSAPGANGGLNASQSSFHNDQRKGSAAGAPSGRRPDGRDLTHPRFRADLHVMFARRNDTHVPEHDKPVWYSNNGLVWMANDLHGPHVVL